MTPRVFYAEIAKIKPEKCEPLNLSILDQMLAKYEEKLKSFGRHYRRELAREFNYSIEYEDSFSSDAGKSETESEREEWELEFDAKFGRNRKSFV